MNARGAIAVGLRSVTGRSDRGVTNHRIRDAETRPKRRPTQRRLQAPATTLVAQRVIERTAVRCRNWPRASLRRVLSVQHTGYMGIDEAQCLKRGCCWDPNEMDGVPWCYHNNCRDPSLKKCSAKRPRIECGNYKIKRSECESRGCCWSPLRKGSKDPWCFFKNGGKSRYDACCPRETRLECGGSSARLRQSSHLLRQDSTASRNVSVSSGIVVGELFQSIPMNLGATERTASIPLKRSAPKTMNASTAVTMESKRKSVKTETVAGVHWERHPSIRGASTRMQAKESVVQQTKGGSTAVRFHPIPVSCFGEHMCSRFFRIHWNR